VGLPGGPSAASWTAVRSGRASARVVGSCGERFGDGRGGSRCSGGSSSSPTTVCPGPPACSPYRMRNVAGFVYGLRSTG
jgi:hypothetical protein